MTPPPEDYCELCDLPLSQCVHGRPPPPEPPPAPRKPTTRVTRATTARPASARATAPAAPVRRAPRLRTPQGDFRPHVLRVLADHGGSLATDAVLDALEERMADVLLDRDRERTPQGELRWRTAARYERRAMTEDGLLAADLPGIWALTDLGRASVPDDPDPDHP